MSDRARNWLYTGATLVVIGVLITLGWSQRSRFAPLDRGSVAPGFALVSLEGDTIRLAEQRGRVVLLNFWATWCAPCRWEMPALDRVHRELGAEGLTVLAVNVDAAPGAVDGFGYPGGDVGGFARELGLGFPILLDPSGQVLRRYRVTGLPTTFLIDREGRVVEKVVGPVEWDQPPNSTRIRRLLEI